jgi:hypothetical protein
MGTEPSTGTIGRTVVVATWLLVLAVAGRPVWAGVLLGVVLLLVWVSPYLQATNRRPGRVARPNRAPTGESTVTLWWYGSDR